MLSVIIPTHNNEEELARTLPALVSAAVSGAMRDVCIYDAGSGDDTVRVAQIAGCTMVDARETAPSQLLDHIRADWLLILPPSARLSSDWVDAVEDHLDSATGAAGAARFRKARDPNLNWWQFWRWPTAPQSGFARGFLISKSQAKAALRGKKQLAEIRVGLACRTLDAKIHLAPKRVG